MIIQIIVALGLVAVMICLFQDCKKDIRSNEKGIDDNQKFMHNVDKKIDILIATLEIKYPTAVKKAKKKNGNT